MKEFINYIRDIFLIFFQTSTNMAAHYVQKTNSERTETHFCDVFVTRQQRPPSRNTQSSVQTYTQRQKTHRMNKQTNCLLSYLSGKQTLSSALMFFFVYLGQIQVRVSTPPPS